MLFDPKETKIAVNGDMRKWRWEREKRGGGCGTLWSWNVRKDRMGKLKSQKTWCWDDLFVFLVCLCVHDFSVDFESQLLVLHLLKIWNLHVRCLCTFLAYLAMSSSMPFLSLSFRKKMLKHFTHGLFSFEALFDNYWHKKSIDRIDCMMKKCSSMTILTLSLLSLNFKERNYLSFIF